MQEYQIQYLMSFPTFKLHLPFLQASPESSKTSHGKWEFTFPVTLHQLELYHDHSNQAAEHYFKPVHTFLIHKLSRDILVKPTNTAQDRRNRNPWLRTGCSVSQEQSKAMGDGPEPPSAMHSAAAAACASWLLASKKPQGKNTHCGYIHTVSVNFYFYCHISFSESTLRITQNAKLEAVHWRPFLTAAASLPLLGFPCESLVPHRTRQVWLIITWKSHIEIFVLNASPLFL